MNLHGPMFVGGVSPETIVNTGVGVNTPFNGCIAAMAEINGNSSLLTSDFIDSANVGECEVVDACKTQPCGDDGTCIELSEGHFRCECAPGKTGKNLKKSYFFTVKQSCN